MSYSNLSFMLALNKDKNSEVMFLDLKLNRYEIIIKFPFVDLEMKLVCFDIVIVGTRLNMPISSF